jgi:hypothetical protein
MGQACREHTPVAACLHLLPNGIPPPFLEFMPFFTSELTQHSATDPGVGSLFIFAKVMRPVKASRLAVIGPQKWNDFVLLDFLEPSLKNPNRTITPGGVIVLIHEDL